MTERPDYELENERDARDCEASMGDELDDFGDDLEWDEPCESCGGEGFVFGTDGIGIECPEC